MELKCYLCNKIVKKRQCDIKSDKIFCNHKCANLFLASTRKKLIKCQFCHSIIQGRGKKYCNNKCQGSERRQLNWQAINDKNNYPKYDSRAIRLILLEKLDYACNNCNNTEWMGSKIPLEVEHIDGNSENNYILNLKLLCPNCHALTPTYKGKNKGNGRYKRRERYKEGKSY